METEEMIEIEDIQEDGMHIEVEPNPSMDILDTQEAHTAANAATALQKQQKILEQCV
jgi:hypothetical protein